MKDLRETKESQMALGNLKQLTTGGDNAIPNFSPNEWVIYDSMATSDLRRLPVSGGDPVKVLDGIVWFNYCLVEKGAYYIDQAGGETTLQSLNFATGKSTIVARSLGPVSAGLTATPDGRTTLFTRVGASADDLMMVENFR